MGTRAALLLLLLLASCMATDGTGTTARNEGPVRPEGGTVVGAVPGSATAAPGQSGGLPAIPRKRPDGLAGDGAQETSVASAGAGASVGKAGASSVASSGSIASRPAGTGGGQAGGPVIRPGAGKAGASGATSTDRVAVTGSGESSRQGRNGGGSIVTPGSDKADSSVAASSAGAAPTGSGDGGRQGPQAGDVRIPQGPDEAGSSIAASSTGGSILPPGSDKSAATSTASTGRSTAGDRSASTSGGVSDLTGAATGQLADRRADGAGATGRKSASSGSEKTPLPGPGELPTADADTARAPRAGTADEAGGTDTGSKVGVGDRDPEAASPAAGLAAAPQVPEDLGIDVESLFDGDVVRYCAAMWQMGEYIGESRRRGEPFQVAIRDGVRRIASEKQLPLDNRLSFSGQVYGRLLYRLEDSHSARAYGAYVHFACLTVRGEKKIVPADPAAERNLNDGLRRCQDKAFARDELNDCLFRELTPIVNRRNS